MQLNSVDIILLLLYRLLTEEQKKYLRIYKTKLNKACLRDILRYVYTTYPKFIEKSRIKDEVLGDNHE